MCSLRDLFLGARCLRSDVQTRQEGVVQQQPNSEHQDAGLQSLPLVDTSLLERNLDIIFRSGEAPFNFQLSTLLSEAHTRDQMARQNSQHRSLGARKAESAPSPLAWAMFTEWRRAEYPKTCCTGSSQELPGPEADPGCGSKTRAKET